MIRPEKLINLRNGIVAGVLTTFLAISTFPSFGESINDNPLPDSNNQTITTSKPNSQSTSSIATEKEPKNTDTPGADRQHYEIVVDNMGVMRRSDTGSEVSYYGTNYTAPFAYSYRALGYEGKDHKAAIDKDVYHIARMGMNAFRLHLWDAELADSIGNLLDNDHLDLLDYTIAEFEKRGIDIILTAQTNFGNGYPERNIDTGAFTYDFDKCKIHEDKKAQDIQERYLQQLVKHKNPYTGRTYAQDKAIIGIEINNEPCHSGTKSEITAYIDRMSKALRKGGFDRIILYNVTHNPGVTSAYYDAKDIQGTTYQWYPTGLVANHERKGNFLPALDNYTIPWEDTIPNYKKLARAVYEFDPADVMYSHLYPAIARTFRGKGFQWITQFAYDPIDLAQYNTEYPTHYMNLVYTPAKALSMMIAKEVAIETPRGANYGQYPVNTKFGHTTVSYDPDLSVYNSEHKFIYTNNTDIKPLNADSLVLIAGHGSSPIVQYTGTGAYFLDKTSQKGVWRLEVMPNVTMIDDPFGNTSLNDAKIIASENTQQMTINLPGLKRGYTIYTGDGGAIQQSKGATAKVIPGTWLIASNGTEPDIEKLCNEKVAGNIGMQEYVGIEPGRVPISLVSPKRGDINLDINMLPEEWGYRYEYKNPSWEEPIYNQLELKPNKDGMTIVRRRVGDKLSKVPSGLNITEMKIAFMPYDPEDGHKATSALPEGTKIGVVSREGYTYSAPLHDCKDGVYSVEISSLTPDEGIIMPAPYPVTLTRKVPKTDMPLGDWSNIEFVQLMVPHKKGKEEKILLKEIWIE